VSGSDHVPRLDAPEGISAVVDLLAPHVESPGGGVEQVIFGTRAPGAIAAMLSDAVRRAVGAGVEGGFFYRASSGSVVGLALADARCVVLKAYQPRWAQGFLRAAHRLQDAAWRSGFPCPQPVAGPLRVGHGWALIDSYVPDPGGTSLPSGADLDVSARGLARLVGAVGGVRTAGLEPHPMDAPAGTLYPEPHNPVFDFAATSPGAEWIDRIAQEARPPGGDPGLPRVAGHLDWSANNVRLGPGGVLVVYDWDSLAVTAEAVVAGQAAATWRSTGETSDRDAPDGMEISRFIQAYADARGRPFTAAEEAAAARAAVWVMAYTARCEHALEQRTPWVRTRARLWLRRHAEPLLAARGFSGG